MVVGNISHSNDFRCLVAIYVFAVMRYLYELTYEVNIR